MGYTTQFQGKIKIEPELSAKQIKFIEGMHGDMRYFAPDDAKRLDICWQQWELSADLDALEWDGNEKFYDADKCMEYVIGKCLEKWPDMKFNGIVQAQGEEFDDRWQLIVKDNTVSKKEVALKGRVITCPNCEEKFELED